MPDSYSIKKITELTANVTPNDDDLYVIGNNGTATMRKVTFANLANWVKTKISALVSSDIVTNATTNNDSKVASASVAYSLQNQIGTVPSGSTLQGQINTLNSNTVCTITRTNNSYVDATALGRVVCKRVGNLYVFYGNLAISTSMPSTATDVEIGRISNYSASNNVIICVPSQSTNDSLILVTITYDGKIIISNVRSVAASGFYRFSAVSSHA